MAEEDQAVVHALASVGVQVNSVYDLVKTKTPYPKAIPVLVGMLRRVTHDRVKEGIARALTVKEARPIAASALLYEFRMMPAENESQRHAKSAVARALAAVADDSVMNELVALMHDKRHGWPRSSLPLAMPNMVAQRPRAVRELVTALQDPNLVVSALNALGQMRAKEARDHVEAFLADPDAAMRQLARRAITRMEKG